MKKLDGLITLLGVVFIAVVFILSLVEFVEAEPPPVPTMPPGAKIITVSDKLKEKAEKKAAEEAKQYKYLVTYHWRQIKIVVCPKPLGNMDKFGRFDFNAPGESTDVACYEQVTHLKRKLFDTEEEAKQFVGEGSQELDLGTFKIQRVKVKEAK